MEFLMILGGFGRQKTNPIKLVLSVVEWSQLIIVQYSP